MMTDTKITTPLLILAGPTASGKTGIAIELARRFNAEIVGADSMQVYRGMDIGTATPTVEELDGVVHHMINVVDPDEEHNANMYMSQADEVIADIASRNKAVLVVGGTGLYIRILVNGIQKGPDPNEELRELLTARAECEGWARLHADLQKIDPILAAKIHANDSVRIVRGLEVYLQSGKSLSDWQAEHQSMGSRYNYCMVGIQWDRDALVERIHRRVDVMMEQGFLGEVEKLLSQGYGAELKPMQGLGYKRLSQYIKGECKLQEAVEQTKIDTRRYAKRQRTWFRKEELLWLPPDADAIFEPFASHLAQQKMGPY